MATAQSRRFWARPTYQDLGKKRAYGKQWQEVKADAEGPQLNRGGCVILRRDAGGCIASVRHCLGPLLCALLTAQARHSGAAPSAFHFPLPLASSGKTKSCVSPARVEDPRSLVWIRSSLAHRGGGGRGGAFAHCARMCTVVEHCAESKLALAIAELAMHSTQQRWVASSRPSSPLHLGGALRLRCNTDQQPVPCIAGGWLTLDGNYALQGYAVHRHILCGHKRHADPFAH